MKNHNPFRYFTTSPEIIRLAVPYNQMGLINVGACLLHAPATKLARNLKWLRAKM